MSNDNNGALYPVLQTGFDTPALEERIMRFWEESGVFHRSLDIREGAPSFVFYEGPPTANGKPGIHHVISRTVKDLVCRYKTMRGYRVDRKAGWDTHGLPVEIEVERQLGLHDKRDVEEYGVAEFNEECRRSVFGYVEDWNKLTRRIGYWLDLDDAYVTYTNEYIESVWWVLKRFFDGDMVYEGHKVIPYCARCETTLSSHEVSQGYREVADPSLFVKIPVRGEEGVFFLVWTTTPWTLLSNVALAVHPEAVYVRVVHNGERIILAEPRLSDVFPNGDYEVEARFPGSTLEAKSYEPLYNFSGVDEQTAYRAVTADFVTMADGTGIVHIAPAFGADDYTVGRVAGLPFVQEVDEHGIVKSNAGPFAGLGFKQADPKIIEDLSVRGLLFHVREYVHDYPFCWRCDSPLIYYARKSWFIRTTAMKDRLIERNHETDWHPPEIGLKRFGEWLENNVDWALSRERFWGTPLPIWRGEESGRLLCVGSIQELRELHDGPLPEPIDLHKPYVDSLILVHPETGERCRRTPEVIDCWFDSGAMPYAQWHYPFENTDEFEKRFPADFICEAVDQTRGWFYSMLVLSTYLFDSVPYRSVVVNGHVLDREGQKMSKSRGNVVDPWEVLNSSGADALRWYLSGVSAPWLPVKFDVDAVMEVERRLFSTFRNSYAFFALYANIDQWLPDDQPDANNPLDRWIASRLQSTVLTVQEALDRYDLVTGGKAISTFIVDDLSNWYVRRSRKRLWGKELTDDKRACYRTLYDSLLGAACLLAPYAPFVSEAVYRGLIAAVGDASKSVHLTDFPSADEAQVDESLERAMETSRSVVSLARAARESRGLKVRQPLRTLIATVPEDERSDVEALVPLIAEEVNVKEVRFEDSLDHLVSITVRPNFAALGKRLGGKMKAAARVIDGLSEDTVKQYRKEKKLTIEVDGKAITLGEGDLFIAEGGVDGYGLVRDGAFAVAVTTELDDELTTEGLARELVNRIQHLRREAGFDITDRVNLYVQAPTAVTDALLKHRDYVAGETLAVSVEIGSAVGSHTSSVDVNGHPVTIGVTRQGQSQQGGPYA
jgi:isoleucyl-tRNA synthetase